MKFCLTVVFLLSLITGTVPQFEFDLSDALDDAPTQKPKVEPKAPVTPKYEPKPVTPKAPSSGDSAGFNLEDAVGPADPTQKPPKPQPKPPQKTGGTGSFDDSDLEDVNRGDYKPDGGRSGGRAADSYDQGGADQPKETGSGPMAGIISAVGVALVGAASSYFAYQKKKLCFKLQGGADPESGKGHQGTQSEPQVLSNLLKINQQP